MFIKIINNIITLFISSLILIKKLFLLTLNNYPISISADFSSHKIREDTILRGKNSR